MMTPKYRSKLEQITEALWKQNDIVGIARNSYLQKKAEKEHQESVWISEAQGDSQAAKAVNAKAKKEWLMFHKELARLEAIYEFQKFKLEILNKEWLAEYQSNKFDEEALKKG